MYDLRNKLRKFLRKEYRDGYMQTHVRGAIAYQIQALREKFDLTQERFAERTGKKQSVISRLESTDGRASVQTLLDIASSLDVALLVRFVSYPEFLRYASEMSTEALQPNTIYESVAALGTARIDAGYSDGPIPAQPSQRGESHPIDLLKLQPSGGRFELPLPQRQRTEDASQELLRSLH